MTGKPLRDTIQTSAREGAHVEGLSSGPHAALSPGEGGPWAVTMEGDREAVTNRIPSARSLFCELQAHPRKGPFSFQPWGLLDSKWHPETEGLRNS